MLKHQIITRRPDISGRFFCFTVDLSLTASSREARVVDENTIFFYAGITEELAENRGDFKIKCEFLEPNEVTEITDPKTTEPTGLYIKKGELG
ncbi:MAG: DUF4361 domain-containing protein [Proteiniphilum sp.]